MCVRVCVCYTQVTRQIQGEGRCAICGVYDDSLGGNERSHGALIATEGVKAGGDPTNIPSDAHWIITVGQSDVSAQGAATPDTPRDLIQGPGTLLLHSAPCS